jgi:hypothetical protein
MSAPLQANFYLVARRAARQWSGALNVRLATRKPSLQPGEVAVRVTLDLPRALFERPALEARISVPADQVNRPTINAAVVENIREVLQQQLGVDLRISLVEPEAK